MFSEKVFRRPKTIRAQLPKPSPTDFGARTIKTKDESFGMFPGWFRDRGADAHPVARGGDFTERNPDLRHAERTGIHAEKNDALPAQTEAKQILFVRRPSVGERVVSVRDRRTKTQALHPRREFAGGGDELFGGAQKFPRACQSDG